MDLAKDKLVILFFFKYSQHGKKTILIVYVDIILTDDDIEEIEQLKKILGKEFKIKNLGQLKYVIGIEVIQSKNGILISQKKYS